MLAMLVVIAAGVLAVFGRFEAPVTWRNLVVGFGRRSSSPPASDCRWRCVMPKIRPVLRERWPFPFNWLAVVAYDVDQWRPPGASLPSWGSWPSAICRVLVLALVRAIDSHIGARDVHLRHRGHV